MNLPLPRPTSVAAWHALVESDKLSKLYRDVIRALYHNGPSTAKEIHYFTKLDGIWKRCSEARNDGFVIETGKRACSITKNVVVEWSLPKLPPDDFDSLVLYYEVVGIVGYKNQSWMSQTKCLSLRRRRNVKGRMETAFAKSFSNVEFVKILDYKEVSKEIYDAKIKTETLSNDDAITVNLVMQAAQDLCDQAGRLPAAIKSSIDRRAVEEFDGITVMVDQFAEGLKFAVDQAKVIAQAEKDKKHGQD